jgi:hypothetical protein
MAGDTDFWRLSFYSNPKILYPKIPLLAHALIGRMH